MLLTFILVAGPLLSLPPWAPAPAAGAPASSAGSWSDSFDAPDEWSGLSSSANATIERGSVVPGWSVDPGTGADGDLSAGKPTYTDAVRTALSGSVQAGGQNWLPVNDSSGFSAGDEALVIQMSGTGAGTWEFSRVSDTAISRITLTGAVANSYVSSGTSRAQVIRVPNWRSVTVNAGCTISCTAWDGATGGVLCFRASGEVAVASGGVIDVSGKGFSGGGTTGGASGGAGGAGGQGGGQSTAGDSGGLTGTGGSGGAGGSGGMGGRRGGDGGPGGGAGSDGSKGAAGKAGQGSTGTGPVSGAGGSNRASQDLLNFQMGGGGGGGPGGNGGAGAGGGGGGGGGRNPGGAGTAGALGGTGGTGAAGGSGGGAVMIIARDIRVEGAIRADGTAGQRGQGGSAGSNGGAGGNGGPGGGTFPTYHPGGGGGGGRGGAGGQGGGGGGGGSGGSIWLTAFNLSLGQNLVSAQGGGAGAGGTGGNGGPGGAGGQSGGGSGSQPGSAGGPGPVGVAGNGGSAGGLGRIRLDSASSAGSVTPPPFIATLSRRDHATVVSAPVAPPSLARWETFSVEYTLAGASSIVFRLLDSNGTALGEWPSSGEGREGFNITAVANTSVRLAADLYANGPDFPSLDSWGLSWSPNRAPSAPGGLTVEGQAADTPGAMNISVLRPEFGWSFSDPDAGQLQGAFNISVWTGPGASGTLMWRTQGSGDNRTAVYGDGSAGTALQWGADYYVRISTRDAPLSGPLWGPAAEMRFHQNSPPAAPALRMPRDTAPGVSRPTDLAWNGSADPENGPLSYQWEVSSDVGFGTLRASGTTDETHATVDLAANALYYWRVRADDGFSKSNWSSIWSFTVTNNRPPAVTPPPRMALFFAEQRMLDLSPYGSDQEDGRNLTWQAALTGGPGHTNYPPPLWLEVVNRTLTVTAGSVEGTFNVTLTAADTAGSTGIGQLVVTVSYTPPNQRPQLSFNGSTIKGGKTLRIDLLKLVRDEEPATLRWEALANNSLIRTQVTGNTLELAAGNPKSTALVMIRLRCTDRFNLSDEATAVFTVKPVKAAAGGEFPWALALAAVAAVIVVLVLMMLVLSRRKASGPRPAPGLAPERRVEQPKEPAPEKAPAALPAIAPGPPAPALQAAPAPEAFDDEIIQMDEAPAEPVQAAPPPTPIIFRPAPPPAAPAPAIFSPPPGWMPPRPPTAMAARPAAARPPAARPPGAQAPRPPAPRYGPPPTATAPARPPAEPPSAPAPRPVDDLPVLEEMEPVKPESRIQAPRAAKGAQELDEIMALLNKKR